METFADVLQREWGKKKKGRTRKDRKPITIPSHFTE